MAQFPTGLQAGTPSRRLVGTPWGPEEHIETTAGSLDGYVLNVDSGYVEVLTTEYEFVILPTENVVARDCDQDRELCRLR